MDDFHRLMAYLRKLPRAVSGAGGHNATLRAACEAVRFGLTEPEQWQALKWYSDNVCDPPWTERELLHKLASARAKAHAGERAGQAAGHAPRARRPPARPVTADELCAHPAVLAAAAEHGTAGSAPWPS